MRAAGTSRPKPLVPIRGVPLLERNLTALLYSGFWDIIVAVPAHTPDIVEFARSRGRELADVFGARLRLFEESRPLGNIGAAAEVELEAPELLVVYADNLTALGLDALVGHHRRTGAALTSAVHLESFRVPFGEVEVGDGMILSYREKPERRIQVSSGLYVLGPAAIAGLARGERTEVSWLVSRLLSAGERVAAYTHDAPWIDVNDTEAVARAERLVASHSRAFECRPATPDATVVSALALYGGQVLLERRTPASTRYPGLWDLPGRVLQSVESADHALEQEIGGCLGLATPPGAPACLFDDIDPASRRVYRHMVFVLELAGPLDVSPAGRPLRLAPWREVAAVGPVSSVVTRALACADLAREREPAGSP
jgi:NDP-mannose synthase